MAVFDKISKATQGAMRGAKDLTDIARFNSMISDERKKKDELFLLIGKAYFENHQEDIPGPLKEMCANIRECDEKISGYQEEIKKLKGAKICSNCGASNPSASMFCVSCGTPMNQQDETGATPQRFCTSCSTAIQDGAIFCLSCGDKV